MAHSVAGLLELEAGREGLGSPSGSTDCSKQKDARTAALWRRALLATEWADRRRQGFGAGGRTKLEGKTDAGASGSQKARRPLGGGALGQPRLPRCSRDPLEGAAVPRSRARSLAPPDPTPASRSPGRSGAGRSRAASGFSLHRRRGRWGGAGVGGRGARRLRGGFGFRNLGNIVK